MVLAVIVFPWAYTIWMSLHEWKVGAPPTFVGLANYIRLPSHARFVESVWHTLVYTALSVALPLILGTLAAVVFHAKFPMRGFLRGQTRPVSVHDAREGHGAFVDVDVDRRLGHARIGTQLDPNLAYKALFGEAAAKVDEGGKLMDQIAGDVARVQARLTAEERSRFAELFQTIRVNDFRTGVGPHDLFPVHFRFENP